MSGRVRPRLAFTVLAVPAALVGAAGLGGAAHAVPAAARAGHVLAATSKRAYLDAGRVEGVKAGDEITLARRGKARGKCLVDAVAEHRASCAGTGFAIGDTFTLAGASAEGAAAPAARALPRLATDEELAHGRAALAAAQVPRVEFRGGDRPSVPARALPAEVTLSSRAYLLFGGSGRTFQAERVGVFIDGAELGVGGVRGSIDAAATHFFARPDEPRFRPEVTTRLEVWQASLASREPGLRALSWGAGRLRPWNAPGLASVDGAQVGWASRDGGLELGALAGVMPDAVTLAPSRDAWIANATVAALHVGARDSWLSYARAEARFGARHVANVGAVSEAEALVLAALGRAASLSAGARGAMAPSASEPARLEAARGDASWRPTDRLRLEGGMRYVRDSLADANLGGVTATPWSGAYQSDWGVAYRVGPRLGLGAVGGWSSDVAANFARTWVGPEVQLPRLFGDTGGASLAYQEELGWFAGRMGTVQTFFHPGERVRAGGRLSVFQDRPSPDADVLPPEIGAGANVQARLLTWLTLRASLLARVGVSGEGGTPPAGLAASVDVVGVSL